MSREAILEKVSKFNKAIGKETQKIEISNYILNEGDKYENFKTNLMNNKSIIHECKKRNLNKVVDEILKDIGTKKLMFGSDLPLKTDKFNYDKLHFNKSINEIYNEAFECDTSIVEARYGVSNFGVLCVTSSKKQPRLLSLLPTNCIVLLQKDKIVESLNDAFEEVTKDTMPTNVIFIIGPSRTSDIELHLVLGVHGSQNLHVVLYE